MSAMAKSLCGVPPAPSAGYERADQGSGATSKNGSRRIQQAKWRWKRVANAGWFVTLLDFVLRGSG